MTNLHVIFLSLLCNFFVFPVKSVRVLALSADIRNMEIHPKMRCRYCRDPAEDIFHYHEHELLWITPRKDFAAISREGTVVVDKLRQTT